MQVGGLVGYLNILADTCSSVAGTVIPPGMEPSRLTIMVLVDVCIFLPLGLFVKSEKLLSATSFLVGLLGPL